MDMNLFAATTTTTEENEQGLFLHKQTTAAVAWFDVTVYLDGF
jgi:hypothetical protein